MPNNMSVLFEKLHFLESVADVRQDHTCLSLLCAFSRLFDTHLGKQVCTFSGSDREMPVPSSKASETHPKISNMFHLHVVTVHIHHAVETLSLWAWRMGKSAQCIYVPLLHWEFG